MKTLISFVLTLAFLGNVHAQTTPSTTAKSNSYNVAKITNRKTTVSRYVLLHASRNFEFEFYTTADATIVDPQDFDTPRPSPHREINLKANHTYRMKGTIIFFRGQSDYDVHYRYDRIPAFFSATPKNSSTVSDYRTNTIAGDAVVGEFIAGDMFTTDLRTKTSPSGGATLVGVALPRSKEVLGERFVTLISNPLLAPVLIDGRIFVAYKRSITGPGTHGYLQFQYAK